MRNRHFVMKPVACLLTDIMGYTNIFTFAR